MNTSKKIICLLMSVLMVLTMAPVSVFAEDTPIYISEIRATSDFVAPEYGAAYYVPAFNFTLEEDLPVSFSYGGNADWFRWVNDGWADTIEDGEYFVDGTYCYDVQITLEDEANYYWDENTKLYVDGVEWPGIHFGGWTKSPAFEIAYVAGKPLIAGFHGHINDSYSGLPIEQSNDTVTAVGGTQPYTFSKVSGPEWLTVSDTGVISGTPTAVGNNDELVVRVTDALGEEATVNIHVNTTYLNPAERQVISRVVGTVDIGTLRCGDSTRAVRNFTAQVIEGAPAELHTGSSDLYDSSMNSLGNSSLVAGEYYMDIQIVVSGEAGYTHMLDAENLEVIINGQTAFDVNPNVGKTSSSDWVKIGGIVVEHWFDNDTDATCNGCDYTREGCDHQYDATCSEACNVCGATREVEHEYNNACDHDCNVCGAVRIPSDHVWTDCYDNYCGVCNFYREDGHVYDDCEDVVCNICEYKRTEGHAYDNAVDTTCGICSYVRTLNYIQTAEIKTVNIVNGGEYAEFLFTPSVTRIYSFCAMGDYDTYGYILDDAYNQLTYNDDNGSSRNFAAVLELTAGTTYVLRARMYSDTETGTFTVQVGCETHTYTDVCDRSCDICGMERDDAPHVWANACDAQCDGCGATRTPGDHAYTNLIDTDCDICGVDRTLNTIAINEVKNVDITEAGEYVDFVFVPEASGVYNFISIDENPIDTHGYIYDAEETLLNSDDDSAGFTHFKVVYEMTAGTPYVLRAKMHNNTSTGSFSVKVICNEHIYTDVCDGSCNLCGEMRENYHVYDNDCDAQCNECSATRTPAEHIYDNVCDKNCNECNSERSVPDHVYDNACDRFCNECNSERSVPKHIYDDNCDEECNECGGVRYVEHNYDNYLDTECNDCSYVRTLKYIQYGDVKTADITVPGEKISYVFTPAVTGNYCFYSRENGENVDSYGYILTVEGNTITSNDDGAGDGMFTMTYELDAGTTYILQARLYNSGSTGSFEVLLTCGAHYFDNVCDTDCNVCGETREVPDHVYSGICDADCNECGVTREAPDHVYDNACDTDCNVCGETREVPDHVYDNACDTDCNVCGETREVTDHVYDNVCDTDCNECGSSRTVGDHVFSNACDTDCNVCGVTREVPDHVYDNVCDTDCNECGAERTVPDHDYVEGICTGCGKEYKIPVSEIQLTYDIDALEFETASTEWEVTLNIRGNVNTTTTGVYKNNGNTMLADSNYSSCTYSSVYLDADEDYHICYNLRVRDGYDWIDSAKATGAAAYTGLTIFANGVNITNIAYCKYNPSENWLLIYVPIGNPTCSHNYDNVCDAVCNECGATREVPDHVYYNACDTTCNICGASRTVGDHVYDNACDATCNVCSASRTVGDHIPDSDGYCSNCGLLADIKVGKEYTVTVTDENWVYAFFTPTVSGKYVITSDNGGKHYENDPYIEVWDYEADESITSCDDYEDYNFRVVLDATAGTVYQMRLNNSENASYGFTVNPYIEIAHQPTAAEPDISLTWGAEGSYQWYAAQAGRVDVTDMYAFGRMGEFDQSVYVSGKGWKGAVIDTEEYNYFAIDLKEGQSIDLTVSGSVYCLGIWCSDDDRSDWDDAVAGTTYTHTAAETTTYYVYCEAASDDVYVNGYIDDYQLTAIDGETKSFTHKKGSLRCIVTLADGRRIMSDVFNQTADLHTYDNACDADCNDCGDTRTPAAHKGGTATCTDKAVCTVCKKSYGSVNKNNHKSLTTLKAEAASCTKEGKTEGKKCTACGVTTVAQQTVAKKAHTYKNVTTKATLTKNGKIENKCSDCGKVKSTTTVYYPKTIKLSKTEYTYNGKVQTPSVTVKDSKGNTLKKDTDYTVKYESGRKATGTYTVTITFKGKYSGTKKLTYTIVPKVTSKITAAQSTKAIKLTWNKVTGADGYRVYQYNAKTKKWDSIKTTTSTSFKVEKLKAGTVYKFKIKAYKKDDGTLWGASSATFTTATKPATPKITKLTTSKGKASFTWSDVSGESGYQVYYSTKKDSGFKKVATYKADVIKGSKSKLTVGKTYYFKVRAYTKTAGGTVYSAWSAVKSVKIK